MMKYLQITFLWIAGILILGHSIIPHHHHDIEEKQCATNDHKQADSDHHSCSHETFIENNELNIATESNCLCEHEQNPNNVCHLFQRTIIQHVDGLTAVLIITRYSIFNPTEKNNIFPVLNCEIEEFHFIGKLSGRAPPLG